jgi:hypothetical protein
MWFSQNPVSSSRSESLKSENISCIHSLLRAPVLLLSLPCCDSASPEAEQMGPPNVGLETFKTLS